MVASYTVKTPVYTSEDVAYLYAHICDAIDIVTPSRYHIVRAKTVDSLYIECLQGSTHRRHVVRDGDYIIYISTADRVGPHATARYKCTRVMCVAHVGPRVVVGTGSVLDRKSVV